MALSPQKRQEVDARREQIVSYWAQGLTYGQITDKLNNGWNTNRLHREINLMRKAGWDVPHRYSEERRNNQIRGRREALANRETTVTVT